MGNDLVPQEGFAIPEWMKKMLRTRTPKKFIKKVKGHGGIFDYVEVGYMRRRLDDMFGLFWSDQAEALTSPAEALASGQVVVHVRIQIRNPQTGQVMVERDGYGSAEVKRFGAEHFRKGQALDLGNDFKGAHADGLKKAASKFGIAADVYEAKVQATEDSSDFKTGASAGPAVKPEIKAMFLAAKNKGISNDEIAAEMQARFDKKATADLTSQDIAVLLDWIASYKRG